MHKNIWSVIILSLLSVAVMLLSACGPAGVAQGDFDRVKQQLGAQEQKANALQQQLSTKDKDLTDTQQKFAVALYAHIETFASGPGESEDNLDSVLPCVKTAYFKRGMHLVWRMEIVDTTTGKVLQANDVKDATVKLPTGQESKFRFSRHGTTEDAPWFWSGGWDIPLDYPLGALDYIVTITTSDGKTATITNLLVMKWAERGMDTRLTIVP